MRLKSILWTRGQIIVVNSNKDPRTASMEHCFSDLLTLSEHLPTRTGLKFFKDVIQDTEVILLYSEQNMFL